MGISIPHKMDDFRAVPEKETDAPHFLFPSAGKEKTGRLAVQKRKGACAGKMPAVVDARWYGLAFSVIYTNLNPFRSAAAER